MTGAETGRGGDRNAGASSAPASSRETMSWRPSREGGVAILGLGASGFAAARLALQKGETVHVSDLGTEPPIAERARELEELGARVELGTHDVARIANAGVVVVSPGIPPDAPVLRELRARSVAWISEPEFAARFYEGSLIAVTGTNGKTTTALLVGHLLEEAGVGAAVGGNVGVDLAPAASSLALLDPPPAWYVLEMSSFQLADTLEFAPDIGVVTTLAPDHLDRYPDTKAYYADKARLFRNATAASRWVLNGDVPAVRELPGSAPGVRCYFARDPAATDGAVPAAFLRDDRLVLRVFGEEGPAEEPLARVDELPLAGAHQVSNALAGALTARLAGASTEGIRKGLLSVRALPHRMEVVADLDGVRWVNDSKATNVGAARAALEGTDRPIVVVLGGKDKGEDFAPLAQAMRGRVRAAVLYGQAGSRLLSELEAAGGGSLPLRLVSRGFDEAVEAAAAAARAGDVLLLSPACSSFDLFPDYRARGDRFRELARRRGGAR